MLFAYCQVCGEEVTFIMFGPHIEDHEQAGEFPEGRGQE
jgi:hypothetical protein